MTSRRWMVVAVLVLAELGVFAWKHDDVVALNGPRERLVSDARFPELARSVVARDRVSRRLLERVVDIAAERGDADIRILVLERIAAGAPDDGTVRLRLASALREAGRPAEAERIFREELARVAEGAQR